MAALTPREVPDLRLSLLRSWSATGTFTGLVDAHGPIPKWESQVLGVVGLWWVSAAMMDLLVAAMPDVPDDLTPEDLLPPDEAPGLVVFEKPLHGIDRSSQPLLVDAIVWGGSLRPILRDGQSELAIAVSSYVRVNPEAPITERLTEPRSLWGYLGQSTWPMSDRLRASLHDGQPEEELVTSMEDRRLLAALWTFLAQTGIADRKVATPDRPSGRRHRRAGLTFKDAEVQVVTLRRVPSAEPDAGTEPSGRDYANRWLVSGHWRRQRVGPGLTETRLLWVSPYVKGPADKPLRTPDVVRAWVR